MAITRRDRARKKRRVLRVRNRLDKGALPRVSVFRSLNNVYGQIIDDNTHTTIASCSSLTLKDVNGDKKEIASAVGKELAKRAKDKGIDRVMFDRGSCKYHGRVKAFADGLREGGVQV